jgi:CheY-like chemotaxis protein
MSFILIVDDSPIVREPIAAALRSAGYETGCAASGTEALAKLQSRMPALMLLDVSMPGIDGLDLLRTLRDLIATQNLPVILLTGSSDRQLVLRAAELGVRDYMLKSAFSLDALISRVGARIAADRVSRAGRPTLCSTSDARAMAVAIELAKSKRSARTHSDSARSPAKDEDSSRPGLKD